MRKRAFVCIDSLGRWLTERPEWFAARQGYDAVVCTIPVIRSDVDRFRVAMPGTKLLGYTDPFHINLAPDSWRPGWIVDLPGENWLRDGVTGDRISRYGYDAFYVHTGLTARYLAREHALLALRVGLDGLYLDNLDAMLTYRYDRVGGATRTLRWRGGVKPFQRLQQDYVIAARQMVKALRAEFGDGTLIANSGSPWPEDADLSGRSQERYVTPASFASETQRGWNFAIAYPDTWARLQAMIADGTLPETVGIMEDRALGAVV